MCAPFSANAQTSAYGISVNLGSTTNLTFDLNGNMTSDGTNAYGWDAENRMVKITYPGSNNFSTFVYDGLSRNVSLVETTAGSVTSTKQFVWSGGNRAKEERDASGALTKKFLGRGQINSTTKYFYDADHLGSIREMTDNSGVLQVRYDFDPFGRVTKISETVASDFGYADYYIHSRSGLNLTKSRAYNALLGRFISRDPIEEEGGLNLYSYVENNPIIRFDPSGTAYYGTWQEFISDLNSSGAWATYQGYIGGRIASVAADLSGLGGIDGGTADGFRHCLWSCGLTKQFGPRIAQNITDSHERNASVQSPDGGQADYHNNAAGRGAANCPGRSCYDECMRLATGGRLH